MSVEDGLPHVDGHSITLLPTVITGRWPPLYQTVVKCGCGWSGGAQINEAMVRAAVRGHQSVISRGE